MSLRIIIPVIIVLYSSGVSAQTNAIDSLKRVLQAHKGDRDEVNTLLSLGESYQNENHLDSAIATSQEALRKATTVHDKRSEATAVMYLGSIAGSLGNYGEAVSLLFRSSNLFEKIDDSDGTSEVQMLLFIVRQEITQCFEAFICRLINIILW